MTLAASHPSRWSIWLAILGVSSLAAAVLIALPSRRDGAGATIESAAASTETAGTAVPLVMQDPNYLFGAETGNGGVLGIGAIYFLTHDPGRMRAWYREALGMDVGSSGTNFFWKHPDDPGRWGRTIWVPFPPQTSYFGPGGQRLMINYRVRDLDSLLVRLRGRGVVPVSPIVQTF